MAYLFATGFELPLTVLASMGISSSGTLARETTIRHVNSVGNGGAASLKLPNSSTTNIVVPGVSGTTHIHMAMRLSTLTPASSSSAPLEIDLRMLGSTNCSIHINTAGTISLLRGNTILATSTATVVANEMFLLEIEALVTDTGRIRVYLNRSSTAAVDTGASVDCTNTANAQFDTIRIFTNITNAYIDDLLVADNTTGRATNEWYGVLTLPNGAGSVTDFTPVGSVNNYQNVDDGTTINESDYNEGTTAGQIDRYAMASLPYTPDDILMTQAFAWASRDGAITQLRNTIDSSGTVANGAYFNPATAGVFSVINAIFTVDPDTSAAWDETGINNLEVGVGLN